MERGGASGQATVEWVGIVTLVALMMVGAGLWLSQNSHLPARGPDPIGAVASPLVGVAPVGGALAGTADAVASSGGSVGLMGRLGRLTRAAVDRARAAGELGWDMGGEFAGGFGDRLRLRWRQLRERPLSALALMSGGGSGDVVGAMRSVAMGLLNDPGRAIDYVAHLAGMSPGDAARSIARDAGGVSADVSLDVGKRVLRRLITRGFDRLRGG